MKNLRSGLFLILLALGACAPWTAVGPDNRSITVKDDYTLLAPPGWTRKNYDIYDVFLSRDGPPLNFIIAYREKHERELARTKRTTRPDLLPHEVAELVVAEQKAGGARGAFAVVSSRPATIGGKAGVRVHTRWKTDRGLPIERVTYALVDRKGRLAFIYEAPGLVYFSRGLADFEALMKSVVFL